MGSIRAGVVASLAVAMVVVAFPAVPAHAGIEDGVCDNNESCVFKDAGFRGCTFDIAYMGTAADNLTADYRSCKGQKVNDSISSYQNRTPAWLVMSENPDHKGFAYCVVPGGSGDVLRTFNDKASSLAVLDPGDFRDKWGEAKCNVIDRD